jgi:hypothetical protein
MQHENVLSSPRALDNGATLPGMSRRRDVLGRLPPPRNGEDSDGRLGPDHIDLFIFQILSLKPERKPPIEPLPNHGLLPVRG